MDKIITDNSKVNLNLIKENETLKNLLEIERQQVKRLAEQLNLCGVGCSLPSKKEIVFDDSLMAEIETTDKNLKVLRAVNGWGYAIDVTKIHINEK